MRKRRSYDSLFEGNKPVLLCVLFTVNSIINVISGLVTGVSVVLDVSFLFWSFVYISAAVLPLALFQHLWQREYISERNYLFWISIPLHFVISCGLILLSLFVRGFFIPVPRIGYFVAAINYAIGYTIILLGAVAIDLAQTAGANKSLRNIQSVGSKIGGKP